MNQMGQVPMNQMGQVPMYQPGAAQFNPMLPNGFASESNAPYGPGK